MGVTVALSLKINNDPFMGVTLSLKINNDHFMGVTLSLKINFMGVALS